MNDELRNLVAEMLKGNYKEVDKFEEGTPVYQVSNGDMTLTLEFWNSSDSGYMDCERALNIIAIAILEGNEDGGTVSNGWNDIMYEII